MSKSPEEMANTMIANMQEKTGKTLEEWLAIARKSGQEKHGEIVNINFKVKVKQTRYSL